jgi:ATP-binding cassette, subfamily B, multidrug efflux pump
LKHLYQLKKYFWRNKYQFFFGILFTVLSNYFGVLSPQITKYVVNRVSTQLDSINHVAKVVPAYKKPDVYEPLVKTVITKMDNNSNFSQVVIMCGIVLLLLAFLRGLFTFFMRQTIIVMSRHIEYDQKNDVYQQYQKLDAHFFKTNSTGDLMNRIAEDVSKVRMFTGPAIMYSINLIALISLSIFYMFKTNPILTLYTIAPLPLLALVIYKVNTVINKKSEEQQQQLSIITANAQESYSGIRVIKSFVQEKALASVFEKNSEDYKNKAISLAKTEAWYFPSIALLIGISTLLTIMMGGLYKINGYGNIEIGTIAEFVVYINMLTFPVSSIGWVASIIQRASASQKRVNEFLLKKSEILNTGTKTIDSSAKSINFNKVSFTYQDTNITALKDISFSIKEGEKIAIVGKTGSGKTTLLQLLLRIYEPTTGEITIDEKEVADIELHALRKAFGYVPQEVFLFSDTIKNNIGFELDTTTNNSVINEEKIIAVTKVAHIHNEITQFQNGYNTMVGERGVTLSGGQKQRISIARALLKNSGIYIFDDCLSAVDVKTEVSILHDLTTYLKNKTTLFVTHRIYNLMDFDKIIVLNEGKIAEVGTHNELLANKALYFAMFCEQNI